MYSGRCEQSGNKKLLALVMFDLLLKKSMFFVKNYILEEMSRGLRYDCGLKWDA